MIYLNFSDLSEEEQTRLLEDSKKDVERKFGIFLISDNNASNRFLEVTNKCIFARYIIRF
jgi:hypothetical protein